MRRINRRVDFPAQCFLGTAQPLDDVVKIHVADDHQIDIAISPVLLSGYRTVNESDLHTIFQRRQRGTQNTRSARRLQEQSAEFWKYRTLAIGLVKNLSAQGFSNDKARIAELSDFPLDGAVSRAGLTDQLAEIEGFVRMPVEKR